MLDDRVTLDPRVLAGKPVVRGTRLAVEFIIELLARGWSEADILASYPGLTVEDIHACLAYAGERFQPEKVQEAAGRLSFIRLQPAPAARFSPPPALKRRPPRAGD